MRTQISRHEQATGIFLSVVLVVLVAALFVSTRRTSLADMFQGAFVIVALSILALAVAAFL